MARHGDDLKQQDLPLPLSVSLRTDLMMASGRRNPRVCAVLPITGVYGGFPDKIPSGALMGIAGAKTRWPGGFAAVLALGVVARDVPFAVRLGREWFERR
jgi:hypothetical protein